MSAEREEFANRQRRDSYHQMNLAEESKPGEAAEILRYLSEIEDLPINPQQDAVMGQLVSTLASTANLTKAQVESNEWMREIIFTLYLAMKPRKEGSHGAARAWAHGDDTAALEPLDAQTRISMEAFTMNSKLALTRSEDFTAVEEATRNVSESVVHDEASQNAGSGGIMGWLK